MGLKKVLADAGNAAAEQSRGIFTALAGAAGGVLADQWKEYFYCEAMPVDARGPPHRWESWWRYSSAFLWRGQRLDPAPARIFRFCRRRR